MTRMFKRPPSEHFKRFDFSRFEDAKSAFRHILQCAPHVPNEGTPRLNRAFEIANGIFQGELRKDGKTPAIAHTLGVAYYTLVLLGGRESAGCIALLHDIEDGPKYRLSIGYQYVKKWFGPRIARDVEYMTVPKCIGKNPDGSHIWITSSDPQYAFTKDLYAKDPMPPETYKEMRQFYLRRMLCADGLRAFCIKLCDAMSNLEDIKNLPADRRDRKLVENMLLVELAARLHWNLYELMSESVRTWNYPVPDLTKMMQTQEARGFTILPPRSTLDPLMFMELPIRHPNSSVISIYLDSVKVHDGTSALEIGMPSDAKEAFEILRDMFKRQGIHFSSVPSLLSRSFDMDARERIYSVHGISQETQSATDAAVERFIREVIGVFKQYPVHELGMIRGGGT